MHLEVIDNHELPVIKLLNSNIIGLEDTTNEFISALKNYINLNYTHCKSDEYATAKTLENIRKKYDNIKKFYYPNGLYVTVTLRAGRHNQATLTLNKSNSHTLDVYYSDIVDLLSERQIQSIAEYLTNTVKRYKYLL